MDWRICFFSLMLVIDNVYIVISRDINAHSASKATVQVNDEFVNKQDWDKIAQAELDSQLRLTPNMNQAKNVILFIGDGMGITDQTVARFLLSEKKEQSIDKVKLAWEKWGYTGLAKTYSVDFKVPDSAATATAFYSGVKAQDGTLGLNQHVNRGNCSAQAGNEVIPALHQFMQEGKWGGVVSTARITHATPAAAYAHSAERNWEVDASLSEADRYVCEDIAHQLIHTDINKQIRVILGGGTTKFLPTHVSDPERPSRKGQRLDGKNLIEDWIEMKANIVTSKDRFSYVTNTSEFDQVDPQTTDYLLGLFEYDAMQYELDRDTSPSGEPSLAQLTEKAIKLLSRSEKGYFLTVEGARIDHAHHPTNPVKALNEILMLSEAAEVADELTSEEDTLIILTADHEHPFTFTGPYNINSKILDIIRDTRGAPYHVDDGKPYLGLSYAMGPGHKFHKPDPDNQQRIDLTNVDTSEKNYEADCTLPLNSGYHGGGDVAIYARGPMAHLFTGSHEQHYIAKAYLYAACVGSNKKHCENISNVGSKVVMAKLSLLLLVPVMIFIRY